MSGALSRTRKTMIAGVLFAVAVVIVAAVVVVPLARRPDAAAPDTRSSTSTPSTVVTRAAHVANDVESYASCIKQVKAWRIGGPYPKPDRLQPRMLVRTQHSELVVVSNQKYTWACRLQTVDGVLRPVLTAPDRAVATDFAVSDDSRSDSAGELVWSAGSLPKGVTAVTYRFPDGHRESAITKNGYWVMEYVSDTTISVRPGGRVDGYPMVVTLAGPGLRKQLTVKWGICERGRRGTGVAMGC